jgi:2-oxoglutarate dehydrogenase E1 component
MDESEEEYIPLSNLSPTQAPFYIYNSLLSEYGVLGFDYGYAMASPNTLTIWEAQFGDFNNGAQIIIDQYLSSAEDKWRRMNGICMFLPHGYEGQGSEHSSARMERFLVLCAEYNMYVVNITTPANFFHALRRQLKNNFRKPLIAFTPKSLLRHPKCVSKLEDFSTQKFKEVIDDEITNEKDVKRILFCTGKIYYDLDDYRTANKINKVAIVRIEQLYPFPLNQVNKLFDKYSNATEFTWVQEEPENMGAWPFLHRSIKTIKLNVIAREASASPATGSPKMHASQQKLIVETSFANL